MSCAKRYKTPRAAMARGARDLRRPISGIFAKLAAEFIRLLHYACTLYDFDDIVFFTVDGLEDGVGRAERDFVLATFAAKQNTDA